MKKIFALSIIILISMLFISSKNYAQNNPDIGQKIKLQLNKYFDLTGDKQYDCDEALKIKKRIKLHESCGECNGFVDEDGDGVCDNCGGIGICDRDRIKDGEGLKRRGGN